MISGTTGKASKLRKVLLISAFIVEHLNADVELKSVLLGIFTKFGYHTVILLALLIYLGF